MYTDEQLDQLEQEEHSITEEALIAMLAILGNTQAELEKELRNFYQKYGKDGVVTYQEARKWVSSDDHRKRLFVLYLCFQDVFNRTLEYMTPQFETLIRGVITKESEFFKVDLDYDKLVDSTWGVDNQNWSNRLTDDVELWLARMINDCKVNLLQRKNIAQVLEQLDERFDSMTSVLHTLVQSESTAYGSIARKEVFKELGVKKYRFYTRPDERRCEHCGALHGLIFPISAYEVGVTASPIHPRCRCWEVPIID